MIPVLETFLELSSVLIHLALVCSANRISNFIPIGIALARNRIMKAIRGSMVKYAMWVMTTLEFINCKGELSFAVNEED